MIPSIDSNDLPYRNKLINLLNEKDNGKYTFDEENCRRIYIQLIDEKQLAGIRKVIRDQYIKLLKSTSFKGCAKTWQNEITFSETTLHQACIDIMIDMRILLTRRYNLIGKDKKTEASLPSNGKIAGITTYRLSRAHIIHLNSSCIDCNRKRLIKKEKPCPITTLNTEIAIHCGLFFIKKTLSKIPDEVSNEIIFTLHKRHTNQETLGVVFDALETLIKQ